MISFNTAFNFIFPAMFSNQESYDRAKTILKTHQSELKSLSQALLKYETLDAEDIKTIVDGKQLRSRDPTPVIRPTLAPLPTATTAPLASVPL